MDTAPSKNLSITLIWVSMASSFLSMQYGYNLWIVYSPILLLEDFYNITSYEEMANPEAQMFLMAVTIALFPFGAMFGALVVGYLMDRFGRKGVLVIINPFSTFSALLMGYTLAVHPYEYTMFVRLFTGLCTGIISIAVPMYLGEISPRGVRGRIIMIHHLFLTSGILVARILALHDVLGTPIGWPMLMRLAGLMSLSQSVLLPFLPESPRYLLIQKRNEEKARAVLKRLRERDDVEDEIEDLHQEDIAEKAEKNMNILKLLRTQSVRWQVRTVIVIMGGQQLSGFYAANYYAERIYLSTNVGMNNVGYITIASTTVFLFTSSVAMCLVDYVGRRVMTLVGFGICSMICLLLPITLEIQHIFEVMAYVNAVFIDTFFIGYAMGPGPIPHILVIDLFLQSSRASAYAIAGIVEWFFSFFAGLTFLHIEKHLGSYSFLLFWPVCTATFFYILKIVPETKNMSFVDIKRFTAMQIVRRIQVKEQETK